MPFDIRKFHIHATPLRGAGPTIWHYDGGEDLPSEVCRKGYFAYVEIKPADRIMIVCADGAVHMDAAVVSAEPVEVGVLARYPDGSAFRAMRTKAVVFPPEYEEKVARIATPAA